ncbi:MAG TPA: hypothetical protein VGB71_16400 [Flavisolibacter sp.]|jgi:hypothetical protein
MKNWILLLFFFPLASFAQDTCGLKKSKDPFTNQIKLSTGFKNFSSSTGPVSISADATPTEIDFFIWVKTEGRCFELESTAQVIWEGERSKATFRNSGSMNCDGAFHFNFKNTATPNSWLRKMMAKKIATIKLTGNNNVETTITLTEEQKEMFQRMAICIANEGKELNKK